MSNSIPFTRDLPRKLLALALALLIWWRVYLGIQNTRTINFVVSTEPNSTGDYVLEIREPEGWHLVGTSAGNTIAIEFTGVTSDLDSYLNDGVRGRIVAVPDALATLSSTQPVDFADGIDWPDTSRASISISGRNGEESFSLALEKLESLQVQLDLSMLPVTEGDELPGFELATEEAHFSPSSIELEGPSNRIQAINETGVRESNLFKPIVIDGSERSVYVKVELTDKAIEDGLRIKETDLELRVPVYPVLAAPFKISPGRDQIQLIGVAPESAPGEWAVNEYRGRGFYVHYRHDPLIEPIPDEATLRQSILFFVNLSDLPSGAVNGEVMPLEWVVRDPSGLDDAERLQALKRAITLVPVDPNDPNVRSVTLSLP